MDTEFQSKTTTTKHLKRILELIKKIKLYSKEELEKYLTRIDFKYLLILRKTFDDKITMNILDNLIFVLEGILGQNVRADLPLQEIFLDHIRFLEGFGSISNKNLEFYKNFLNLFDDFTRKNLSSLTDKFFTILFLNNPFVKLDYYHLTIFLVSIRDKFIRDAFTNYCGKILTMMYISSLFNRFSVKKSDDSLTDDDLTNLSYKLDLRGNENRYFPNPSCVYHDVPVSPVPAPQY